VTNHKEIVNKANDMIGILVCKEIETVLEGKKFICGANSNGNLDW
jgi:hypothetical protein